MIDQPNTTDEVSAEQAAHERQLAREERERVRQLERKIGARNVRRLQRGAPRRRRGHPDAQRAGTLSTDQAAYAKQITPSPGERRRLRNARKARKRGVR